jgi:nicotinamide-nucleotide amidase
MKATILAIGDELLNGRTQDTNSNFICSKFAELGAEVVEVRVLGDEASRIERALEDAVRQSELVITTGGLGPTTDDLTRFSLAKVAGCELVEDQASIERLEERARSKGRKLYQNGKLQALFPDGSEIVENPTGTANSFITEIGSIPVFSLPGVPRELKYLVENELLPFVSNRFKSLDVDQPAWLHCFGYSESWIGSVVEGLNLGEEFNIAYRPDFPEIMLTIRGLNSVAAKKVEDVKEQIRNALGSVAYSDKKTDSLELDVSELLRKSGKKVAIAESCTGGLLSSRLVAIPGASEIFDQSVVTYSNPAKISMLGVSESTLEKHGAVSAEVAFEMASGLLERSQANLVLVTTGIAGPDGGTEEKPVGTVFLGLGTPKKIKTVKRQFGYSRSQFRQITSSAALDLLRRELSGLDLEFEIK